MKITINSATEKHFTSEQIEIENIINPTNFPIDRYDWNTYRVPNRWIRLITRMENGVYKLHDCNEYFIDIEGKICTYIECWPTPIEYLKDEIGEPVCWQLTGNLN